MRKTIIYTLLALLIIVLGVAIISYASNPLRKSEEQIRESMLKLTPIGTSMDEVTKVIEDKKWEITWVKHDHNNEYTDLSGDFIVGAKSIKATVGSYRKFFIVYVEVYWGFDENDKLIAIEIRKDAVTL
ncbi:MAG: hypothetical protein PHE51_09095 [Eubacteriales bacterium]|nr:hypothetical protein [Eubacteriales bacterium]